MSTVATVLQTFLALYYLGSGIGKIAGAKFWLEAFARLKLPPWLRIVAGAVQLVGAIALVAGYWSPGLVVWAGVWLGVTMLIACAAHLRVRDRVGIALPGALFSSAVAFVLFNAALVALQLRGV